VFFDCRGKEFVPEGQTANQDVYRGVLQHSILSPWVLGNREVVPPTWQCVATYSIICQIFVSIIKSLYCCISHILLICHLVIFSYSHDYNKHWKAIAMLTWRPFKWSWQNGCATFQKVLSKTASKTSRNTGSNVLMYKKAILKESLSIRVQVHHTHFYTVSLWTFQTEVVCTGHAYYWPWEKYYSLLQ
jgi:hypothetical protein